jgi:hypothetical protein
MIGRRRGRKEEERDVRSMSMETWKDVKEGTPEKD